MSGKYRVNSQEETSDSGAETPAQAAKYHVLFATTGILPIVRSLTEKYTVNIFLYFTTFYNKQESLKFLILAAKY